MIKLPMIFSEHMMLQQEKPVHIFGEAAPGANVRAGLYNARGEAAAKGETAADASGAFDLVLPPLCAGLDLRLVLTDGTDDLTILDVAVGELWLAGGQSNMEFLMNTDAELPKERERLQDLTAEERRAIRFFDYPEISFPGMEEMVDLSSFGKWRCLSEEDLPFFSAVCYFFERKIAEKLQVPVGVIGCNWGGTKAVCWLPEKTVRAAGGEVWLEEYEEELKKIPDLERQMAAYKKTPMNVVTDPKNPDPWMSIMIPGFPKKKQEDAQKMQANMPEEATLAMMTGPLHPWRPCGLYETMLRKLMPYTIRGFLWYQGCSDELHTEVYAQLQHALIEKWREDFGDPELPFLFVQIAPFGWWLGNGSDNYPALREAQEKAADMTENAWLASMGDAGMRWDIHPKHKRKPGERLALLALRHVYGEDVAADAPRAKSLEYDEDTAVIRFENGEGLALTDAENGGLTEEEAAAYNFSDPDDPKPLAPQENLNALIETVPAGEIHAEVRDDTLRVQLTIAGKPVRPEHLSFAWTGYYEVNVKNAAGLPVFPFRF